MRYRVNKVAKIKGVNPRTLRFYDETALLKSVIYAED